MPSEIVLGVIWVCGVVVVEAPSHRIFPGRVQANARNDHFVVVCETDEMGINAALLSTITFV